MGNRSVSSIFVARHPETAQLRSAYQRAAAGRPGAVVIGGEAGVGKSRLIEEFAAGLDATVAYGACIEMDGEGIPFAPFTAVLRELARAGQLPLDGWEAAELGRLLPELALTPAASSDDDFVRTRVFEAVGSALTRAALDRPLVVVVDDLHWADRASRDLFGFLARTVNHGRVLLIGAFRDDELHRGHPLRPFLAELDRARRAERIDLGRFDRAQTAAQLAGILAAVPSAEVVDEVYSRAEGNAFFTEEVACGVARGGCFDLSWTLRDLLMARVERLPEPTQRLLRILSAAVPPSQAGLVAAVTGLSPAELTETLRPAFAANILAGDEHDRSAAPGFCFRHALMREVIRDELLPGEDVNLYLRMAELLEADPSLVPADRLDSELAHYWYRANVVAKALPAALRAAETANAMHAYSDELALLKRALTLWDRVPHEPGEQPDEVYLLYRASVAANQAGLNERSLAFAQAGLAKVDEVTRPALAAHLLELTARQLRNLGRGDGLAEQRRAVGLVPRAADPAKRGFLLTRLANAMIQQGRLSDGVSFLEEAIELGECCGKSADLFYAKVSHGAALVRLGRIDEGLSILAEVGRSVGSEPGAAELGSRLSIYLSDCLTNLGRFREAADQARQGLEHDPCGTRMHRGPLAGNLAEALIALGAWSAAERRLQQALDLNPTGVHELNLCLLRAFLANLRGDFDAADQNLTRARRAGGQTRERQYVIPLHLVTAHLAAARGRIAPVRAALDAVLADRLLTGDEWYVWPLLAVAAQAEADLAAGGGVGGSGVGGHSVGGSGAGAGAGANAGGAAGAGVGDSEVDWARLARIRETAAGLATQVPLRDLWSRLVRAELARAAAHQGGADFASPDGVDAAEGSSPEVWRGLAEFADEIEGPVHVRAYLRYRQAHALVAEGSRGPAAEALALGRALAETDRNIPGNGDHRGERTRLEPLLARMDALARAGRLTAAATGAGSAESGPVLTARELDVLRLVVEGLSNGQIAARLFIATKTVSVHVSNILAKLGVASRTEAAAYAHRTGLLQMSDHAAR